MPTKTRTRKESLEAKIRERIVIEIAKDLLAKGLPAVWGTVVLTHAEPTGLLRDAPE